VVDCGAACIYRLGLCLAHYRQHNQPAEWVWKMIVTTAATEVCFAALYAVSSHSSLSCGALVATTAAPGTSTQKPLRQTSASTAPRSSLRGNPEGDRPTCVPILLSLDSRTSNAPSEMTGDTGRTGKSRTQRRTRAAENYLRRCCLNWRGANAKQLELWLIGPQTKSARFLTHTRLMS